MCRLAIDPTARSAFAHLQCEGRNTRDGRRNPLREQKSAKNDGIAAQLRSARTMVDEIAREVQ